jgi:hypothetical protein
MIVFKTLICEQKKLKKGKKERVVYLPKIGKNKAKVKT